MEIQIQEKQGQESQDEKSKDGCTIRVLSPTKKLIDEMLEYGNKDRVFGRNLKPDDVIFQQLKKWTKSDIDELQMSTLDGEEWQELEIKAFIEKGGTREEFFEIKNQKRRKELLKFAYKKPEKS